MFSIDAEVARVSRHRSYRRRRRPSSLRTRIRRRESLRSPRAPTAPRSRSVRAPQSRTQAQLICRTSVSTRRTPSRHALICAKKSPRRSSPRYSSADACARPANPSNSARAASVSSAVALREHRRDHDALLVERRRHRHRSGSIRPDVRVMRTARGKSDQSHRRERSDTPRLRPADVCRPETDRSAAPGRRSRHSNRLTMSAIA